MFDVCVIGHVSKDVIAIGGEVRREMPGGVALYAGAALTGLGLRTAIVTKVAAADAGLLAALEERGATVSCGASAQTTAFENIYVDGGLDERRQRLGAVAAAFEARDLGDMRARVFLLGPLMGTDMSAEFVGAVAARGGRVALDVQGLVRRAEGGEVRPADWAEKGHALGQIDILKADAGEAAILAGEGDVRRAARRLGRYGPREVIVTLGSRGSIIYAKGRLHEIPAFAPRRAVDPTGCGDTYLAGYVFARLAGEDIAAAGRFGAALATLKLERFGPSAASEADVRAFLDWRAGGTAPS